jgi:glycosyltransferase involved in cell wall biosynthesis
MRIALINDYLTRFGGAEKTFKVLTEIFPDADIYTLFYDPSILNKLKLGAGKKIKTSFLQKFPLFLRKKYQLLLPFLPVAAESLDLRDYDLVISSSHSFAKGIITRPKTIHICYCYSPTRYLWDKSRPKSFLNYFRIWDRQASERVDQFVAVSKTVQNRIKKYYKRDSVVIYPPVEVKSQKLKVKSQDEFYLIVSQLRKYKRIDLAVEAFNKLGLNLVIIGQGPERKKLQRKAKKNIKFLGWKSDEIVAKYYKNCIAFIFPSDDDFGIAPVEAMSYGKPVLAFKKGGALETIIEGKTGEFFDFQNVAVLADGVRRLRLNPDKYDPKFISSHAQKFSRQRFEKEFKEFIDKLY